MPGIYGLVTTHNALNNLKCMAESMHLYQHFLQDELFSDQTVAISRTHLGHIGTKSPVKSGHLSVWLEGEAYNIASVCETLNIPYVDNSVANLLIAAEYDKKLIDCLSILDGYFCAAIYDSKYHKIKLITDRYGMRLLYMYHKNAVFAWGSEVKAILAIDGVDKQLDTRSFNCFMDLGHLMGEHTFFKHIKLIKPSTVIEYDLINDVATSTQYWKWSNIQPLSLSFEQSVDELGNRFIQSVRRRFNSNERIGISLSGGLDSRALFAAVNFLFPDYVGYAYTYGIPNCDDIAIAENVIAKSKWRHQLYFFIEDNWFQPRKKNIWNTDGMLDMKHMHGSEFLDQVSYEIDINLNGYLGDAVCGGSYMSKSNRLGVPVNNIIATDYYGEYAEGYDDVFFESDHFDNYLFMMRGRRFINYGTVNALPWIDQRIPFFDNDLIELIFGLPDAYRANNRIYSAMLQKYFPSFFKNIPWQQTGKPAAIIRKPTLLKEIFRKGMKIFNSLVGMKSTKDFVDYAQMIRNENVIDQLMVLFYKRDSHYQDLYNKNPYELWCQPHMNVKFIDYSNIILRAITIEIYLQHVLGGYQRIGNRV